MYRLLDLRVDQEARPHELVVLDATVLADSVFSVCVQFEIRRGSEVVIQEKTFDHSTYQGILSVKICMESLIEIYEMID